MVDKLGRSPAARHPEERSDEGPLDAEEALVILRSVATKTPHHFTMVIFVDGDSQLGAAAGPAATA
jgi:hypothetical protein